MRIRLEKFGTTLVSRQSGREALAAFQPTLRDVKPEEIVEIDFSGVVTFTPSWADEFLTSLLEQFKERVVFLPSKNPSVIATLDLLKRLGKIP